MPRTLQLQGGDQAVPGSARPTWAGRATLGWAQRCHPGLGHTAVSPRAGARDHCMFLTPGDEALDRQDLGPLHTRGWPGKHLECPQEPRIALVSPGQRWAVVLDGYDGCRVGNGQTAFGCPQLLQPPGGDGHSPWLDNGWLVRVQ